MAAIRRAAALALISVLFLAGCVSGDNTDRLRAGTLIYGVDQEPAIINPWLSEGNLQVTYNIALSMLSPLWKVTPDFEYEPLLLDGEPEITEDPFTVTYKLKDEATWSDGEPITARDIEFTLETCLNPDFAIAVREGCERVDMEQSEIVDDKTYKAVFTEPYGPWKSLFSTAPGAILPAHELEGEDFNDIWDSDITVSSGPFKLEDWSKGQNMTLVKNEEYWGEEPGLERIVLRFIEDSTVQVQALRGGEIDMLTSQPQLDLVDQVEKIPGVEYQTEAGGLWEFFEFNFATEGLGEDFGFVRQAIALGINRQELTEALISPMNDEAEPLNSIIYVNTQEQYEPAFDTWQFDPEAARRLLDENGCEPGADGIRTCGDVRLSFDYGYTSGNELRELQFVVLQSYLQDIGIELNSASEDAASFFGETWQSGQDGSWELFNQAWSGSADPNPALGFWRCEGELNYRSYCNEEVDELIQRSTTELDPQARQEQLNEANAIMADELPALPLYQKPVFLAWDSELTGPQANPTDWGPMWNVGEWQPR